MKELLTIVLPCYNEAQNLPLFLPQLLKFAQQKNYKVIIVNDGSSDRSYELLCKFAVEYSLLTVVNHKVNRGYGGALKSGLMAVETMYAVTVDADGQHRLEDVEKCFECISSSNADLVVGARTNNESGTYRTVGKFLIRLFARSLFELPIKDLNSGMKCYRMSETKQYLELCPNSMAFSDVIALLMINDRRMVIETPIIINSRTAGTSTIGTQTALNTIWEILNLSILLRPMATFFRLGVFFLCLGIMWCTFTYLKSKILSSAAVMLIIFSLFSFLMGLLGEQLAQIRKLLARKGM